MNVRLIDGKIPTTPGMLQFVNRHVARAAGRFAAGIAEVRVRIADVNGPKGGVDKRCIIIAKLDGRGGTLMVRHRHTNYYGAIAAAAEVLKRRLARGLGDRAGRGGKARRSSRTPTAATGRTDGGHFRVETSMGGCEQLQVGPGARQNGNQRMKSHPTFQAKDIMTAEPVCAEPSTTIRQLARLFEDNDISGCPVVDHEGKVIGVVSKTDLIRRCSEGTRDIPPAYLFEVVCEQGDGGEDSGEPPVSEPLVCVQDFMTDSAVTVGPNAPVHEVAALMSERHIHRVVVVDDEMYPLGVITALDVLKAYPRPGG